MKCHRYLSSSASLTTLQTIYLPFLCLHHIIDDSCKFLLCIAVVVQDFISHIQYIGSYSALRLKLSICVIGFLSQAPLSKGGLRYGKKRLLIFLGKKIFEIPPFFQTRPGDLGKKVHACSLRFSALKRDPGWVWSRGPRTKLIPREESFVSQFFCLVRFHRSRNDRKGKTDLLSFQL